MPVTSARIALLAVIFAGHACAETPASSGVVVAPVVPASSLPAEAGAAPAAASDEPTAPEPAATDAGAPAQFRACAADTDCVAVPRVGCCHNGWMEAVAVSQKDAYAASFVCPEAHPICAMFIIRDRRVARCNTAAHLCELGPGR